MKWELLPYKWCRNIDRVDLKKKAAESLVELCKEGDVIGVGTGSSSYIGLKVISEFVKKNKINVTIIPAALEMEMACIDLGLNYADLNVAKPDWCFDGADEIDDDGNVIKGRGGGLFKEKLIIKAAKKRYLILDDSKFVKQLNVNKAIPVDVFYFGYNYVIDELKKLGAKSITIRQAVSKDGPVITENGHLVLDVFFETIYNGLEKDIKSITGVIETGIFQGYNFIIKKA